MFIHLVPGWGRIALIALPPLAAGGILLAASFSTPPPPPALPALPAAVQPVAPAPAGILVYVSGAVVHPGLYRLQRGDRGYEAVAAAGGLTADADPNKMPNLAVRLKDGQQFKVPVRGSSSAAAYRLDLNLATAAELESVPGFSAELAQAALGYREQYGGFASVRELVTVLGMDEASFLEAKPFIKV